MANFEYVRHIIFIATLLILGGCIQNAAFHTLPGSKENCVGQADDDNCVRSYYQDHGNYDLAFAEFSERGNAFSDSSINNVLTQIRQHAQTGAPGAVIVTFIHGWKHNASESDSNLIDFKKTLSNIAGSNKLGERRLIGLYVGWRGSSINIPWIKNITFWDRKAVAEEVGKGGVSQLLLDIDRLDASQNNNVFVVIGHSFGGAIVVSALTEVLTSRVIRRTGRGFANSLGDGVIVLNPAIEANQSLNLIEASLKADFPRSQHPLFVSISTDADGATHRAFPLGQTASLLLSWQQEDLERAYYYDRQKPNEVKLLKEEHLDATTVGNFAPFLTHRLTVEEESADTLEFGFSPCAEVPKACEPRGLTTLSGQPTIRGIPDNYPLYFIKTDKRIMKGHNDIFNNRIKAFMLTMIDDVVVRTLGTTSIADSRAGTSVLKQTERLLENTKANYQQLEAAEK